MTVYHGWFLESDLKVVLIALVLMSCNVFAVELTDRYDIALKGGNLVLFVPHIQAVRYVEKENLIEFVLAEHYIVVFLDRDRNSGLMRNRVSKSVFDKIINDFDLSNTE